jgi:hypothetical protein
MFWVQAAEVNDMLSNPKPINLWYNTLCFPSANPPNL